MKKIVLNCVMGRTRCEDTPAANPMMFQDRRFGLCYTFGGQFNYVLYDRENETGTLKTVVDWKKGFARVFYAHPVKQTRRPMATSTRPMTAGLPLTIWAWPTDCG